MIERLEAEAIIADTAFDAHRLREVVAAKRAIAVLPSNSRRKSPAPLCHGRHLVECCIRRLKHVRRVAIRYWKTARNFPAFVTTTALALCLR